MDASIVTKTLDDGIQTPTEASQCAAVVSSGNAELCYFVLDALQAPEAGPVTTVCGVGEPQANGTGATLAFCRPLAACCSSIDEVGGTAACELVSYLDEGNACINALQYFQSKGYCEGTDAAAFSTSSGMH